MTSAKICQIITAATNQILAFLIDAVKMNEFVSEVLNPPTPFFSPFLLCFPKLSVGWAGRPLFTLCM